MTKQTTENETAVLLQQKIKQLEELTGYFEQTEIDLDEGIKKYEQGMKLVQELKEMLQSYELKIKEIKTKYSDDSLAF